MEPWQIILFAIASGIGGFVVLFWVIMPLVHWFFKTVNRAAGFEE